MSSEQSSVEWAEWERELLAAVSPAFLSGALRTSAKATAGKGQRAHSPFGPELTVEGLPTTHYSLLTGVTVVILGIGNRDRGDDGVGCIIAERLAALSGQHSAVSTQHAPPLLTTHYSLLTAVLDCGTTPENYLSRVASLQPGT